MLCMYFQDLRHQFINSKENGFVIMQLETDLTSGVTHKPLIWSSTVETSRGEWKAFLREETERGKKTPKN